MLSAVKKKLENFFIQNLEKQIKGPLILFHSDVAIVNKALFFFLLEREEEVVRNDCGGFALAVRPELIFPVAQML